MLVDLDAEEGSRSRRKSVSRAFSIFRCEDYSLQIPTFVKCDVM